MYIVFIGKIINFVIFFVILDYGILGCKTFCKNKRYLDIARLLLSALAVPSVSLPNELQKDDTQVPKSNSFLYNSL